MNIPIPPIYWPKTIKINSFNSQTKKKMTRRGGSSTRCGDVVRYVLGHGTPGPNCAGQNANNLCEDAAAVFLDFEHCRPTDQVPLSLPLPIQFNQIC